MCVYIYIYICIHTYVYNIYIYTHMSLSLSMCIYIYICILLLLLYIYIYIYIYEHICPRARGRARSRVPGAPWASGPGPGTAGNERLAEYSATVREREREIDRLIYQFIDKMVEWLMFGWIDRHEKLETSSSCCDSKNLSRASVYWYAWPVIFPPPRRPPAAGWRPGGWPPGWPRTFFGCLLV